MGVGEPVGLASWKPIESAYSGFALLDLGMLFFPTLILLQLGAARIGRKQGFC